MSCFWWLYFKSSGYMGQKSMKLYWQMSAHLFRLGFFDWLSFLDGLGLFSNFGFNHEFGHFDGLSFLDGLGLFGDFGFDDEFGHFDGFSFFDGLGLFGDLGFDDEFGHFDGLSLFSDFSFDDEFGYFDGFSFLDGLSFFNIFSIFFCLNDEFAFFGEFSFFDGSCLVSGFQVSQKFDDVFGHRRSDGQMSTRGAESVLVGDPVDGVGHSVVFVVVRAFGNGTDLFFFLADLFLFSVSVDVDAVGTIETVRVNSFLGVG